MRLATDIGLAAAADETGALSPGGAVVAHGEMRHIKSARYGQSTKYQHET